MEHPRLPSWSSREIDLCSTIEESTSVMTVLDSSHLLLMGSWLSVLRQNANLVWAHVAHHQGSCFTRVGVKVAWIAPVIRFPDLLISRAVIRVHSLITSSKLVWLLEAHVGRMISKQVFCAPPQIASILVVSFLEANQSDSR